MIRSWFANAFILILGLLLLALSGALGLEAVKVARGGGSIDLNNVVPGFVALALGIWCARGGLVNLRHARHEPAEPISFSLIAMRVLSFILSSALIVTVVGVVFLVRGNDSIMVERSVIVAAATLAYGALITLVFGLVQAVRR